MKIGIEKKHTTQHQVSWVLFRAFGIFFIKGRRRRGEIQNLEHVMYLHTYAFACLRLHYTYSACIIEYKVLKPTEIPPTNNLLQIDA